MLFRWLKAPRDLFFSGSGKGPNPSSVLRLGTSDASREGPGSGQGLAQALLPSQVRPVQALLDHT